MPWVEDKNSNMRMFKITTMDDLVPNSMNILEPSPVDDKGNQREDRKFLFSLCFLEFAFHVCKLLGHINRSKLFY